MVRIAVTIEKDLPDARAVYEKGTPGKAIARELNALDLGARSAHVTQISSLLSESQAALIQQMKEEGFDPTKMRLPPEQWFDAAEGLKTVGALIDYVNADLNKFKQPNPILRDLKASQALLEAAAKAGSRFHFTKVVT